MKTKKNCQFITSCAVVCRLKANTHIIMPTHDKTPNKQDGNSALALAILSTSGDDKKKIQLMHALLEAGASVAETVRKALLRDDFWHGFVVKDTSAEVVGHIAKQAPDLADEKDTHGRMARVLMDAKVTKVSLRPMMHHQHRIICSLPRDS